MYRNHFEFKITDPDGKVLHKRLGFAGVDSETAHKVCVDWVKSRYKCDCTAELTDGSELEADNERRIYQILTQQPKEREEIKIFRVLKKAKVEA